MSSLPVSTYHETLLDGNIHTNIVTPVPNRQSKCPFLKEHKESSPRSWISDLVFGSTYKKATKKWKHLVIFILTLIVICFMVWECFTYFNFKMSFDIKDKEIDSLRYQLKEVQTKIEKEIMHKDKKSSIAGPVGTIKPASFSAIHRVGRGNSRQITVKDLPLSKWKTSFKKGNIAANGGYIDILEDGLYTVYTQLHMFGINGSHESYHIYIKRNGKDLATVTMSRDQCLPYCVRYLSTVALLKKHDKLSVGSETVNIPFLMNSNTFFGTYMISS